MTADSDSHERREEPTPMLRLNAALEDLDEALTGLESRLTRTEDALQKARRHEASVQARRADVLGLMQKMAGRLDKAILALETSLRT